MSHIVLEVDGKAYHLKMRTAAQIDAEKALGFPLFDALQNADRADTLPIILTASVTNSRKEFNIYDACKLVDKMTECGFTWNGERVEELGVNERAIIIFDILSVSGFFTTEEIQRVEELLRLDRAGKEPAEEAKTLNLKEQVDNLKK